MKLLSLNTHSLSEKNEDHKAKTIATYILENDIDVIALQEVNQTMSKKRVSADQMYVGTDELKEDNFALFLSSLLKQRYYWNWIPVKVGYDRFDEGVAIFSKYPIVESENKRLTKTNDYRYWKKRNALGVKIDYKGTPVWIYTSHLGWWKDDEEPFLHQWQILNQIASKKERVYLAGDFNAPDTIKEESYETILKDGWYDTRSLAEDVKGRFTAQGKIDGWETAQDMRIDYIFVNEQETVKSHHVVFDGKSEEKVSDHYGINMEDTL